MEDYLDKPKGLTKGWIALGDIVEFKKGKPLKMENIIKGEYPIVSAGKDIKGYHNEFNRNENTICVSCSGAYAGFITKINQKIWADDCVTLHNKNTNYNNELIYYFLKFMQNILTKRENEGGFQKGAGQPHVYSSDLVNIKIPSLTLLHQEEIINLLDRLYKTYKIEDTVKYLSGFNIFNLLINKQYQEFEDILWYQEQYRTNVRFSKCITNEKRLYPRII